MGKHRFELFSDGVFAIVLTLLVLDLRVPLAHGVQAFAEVWPSLLVHTGGFVLVGVLWMIHQGALDRVTAFSVAGIRWNLVCPFWSTLIPFGDPLQKFTSWIWSRMRAAKPGHSFWVKLHKWTSCASRSLRHPLGKRHFGSGKNGSVWNCRYQNATVLR